MLRDLIHECASTVLLSHSCSNSKSLSVMTSLSFSTLPSFAEVMHASSTHCRAISFLQSSNIRIYSNYSTPALDALQLLCSITHHMLISSLTDKMTWLDLLSTADFYTSGLQQTVITSQRLSKPYGTLITYLEVMNLKKLPFPNAQNQTKPASVKAA